jgi:polyhydroxyalkanoate synthesis repressor PhaR
MVTIKKYGNRRLYDTSSSSYINLEQLAELIRAGEEVQVVDVKSGEDLTREVLLQVVMEVLHGGDLFTTSMLQRMIRSTGNNPWARMMNQQLVTGFRMLSTQLDQAERMFDLGSMPQMPGMGGMGFGFPGMGGAAPSSAPKPSPEPEPEPEPEPAAPEAGAKEQLDELRARLADIEKLLRG